jgi:hypothetical protein
MTPDQIMGLCLIAGIIFFLTILIKGRIDYKNERKQFQAMAERSKALREQAYYELPTVQRKATHKAKAARAKVRPFSSPSASHNSFDAATTAAIMSSSSPSSCASSSSFSSSSSSSSFSSSDGGSSCF